MPNPIIVDTAETKLREAEDSFVQLVRDTTEALLAQDGMTADERADAYLNQAAIHTMDEVVTLKNTLANIMGFAVSKLGGEARAIASMSEDRSQMEMAAYAGETFVGKLTITLPGPCPVHTGAPISKPLRYGVNLEIEGGIAAMFLCGHQDGDVKPN
jgi:hypothetical protein